MSEGHLPLMDDSPPVIVRFEYVATYVDVLGRPRDEEAG